MKVRRSPKKAGGSFRRRDKRPAIPESALVSKEAKITSHHIPPPAPGVVRIIPLGGVEAVGQNMTVFETADDIIVVDAGLQFREDETPGIDFMIPNTQYLEERKEKMRAILITHGHLDHIGAIPYIMGKIGNPPIYSRQFTTLMIKKRQEEFAHLPPLNMEVIEKDQSLAIGKMRVKFFGVTHAIPDAMGIAFETPDGDIVTTGDLRVDNSAGVPTEAEKKVFGVFKERKVLALLSDSTNAENPGWSLPEKKVLENIEEVVKSVSGRLIIGTFASQVERIIKIIELCERHGKKVLIEGRSMKTNTEVAKLAGLLVPKSDTMINMEELENYPADRIVVIATGSQGEEFAALMRMGNLTHKHFKVRKGDTVLLSSSVIPGNEKGVEKIKDNLSRQGAKIVHYKISEVHASGHANRDELAWIASQINPKFFIPIHGSHYMLRVHADIAMSVGIPEENIVVPDNGTIIEIQDGGNKIVTPKEKAPSNIVMVDGFSVGNIQEVVIRDRQMLAQDGMFIIVAMVDTSTGKLKKSPDIISRGFIYLRESQDLLRQARFIIKKTIEDTTVGMRPINFEYVKDVVTDQTGRYLFQQTAKRPIVLPVILGV
ncbi:ribonuclease J [bacterium]|nr:ribonuclease J [bacterium]